MLPHPPTESNESPRAFPKDAPILVLDGPTSALDAATERELLGALGDLAEY